MLKYLYVKANPKQESNSNSLTVGRNLVEYIRSERKDAVIDEIDVYEQAIPLIDRHFVSARNKTSNGIDWEDLLQEEQQSVSLVHRYTEQFIAADVSIFAFPLWNFGIPPMLKAYIDTIKIARKTFRYTPSGPVGLLHGKTAVLIQSSGDIYSHGPLQTFEHGSRYLASVLKFIGVERIETILMEGMDKDPELASQAKESALRKAAELAQQI